MGTYVRTLFRQIMIPAIERDSDRAGNREGEGPALEIEQPS